MDSIRIETARLVLRRFEESDIEAIYLLFSDKEVNTFLPWYPLKDMNEAKGFFEKRLKGKKYCFAVCLKAHVSAAYMRKRKTAMTLGMRSAKNTGIRELPERRAMPLSDC